MGRILTGLVILLIGVGLLLNVLGIATFSIGYMISTFLWPVIFLLVGFSFLTSHKSMNLGRLFLGLVFLALAVLYLGNEFGWFDVTLDNVWELVWPVIIIAIGLSILSKPMRRQRRRERRDMGLDENSQDTGTADSGSTFGRQQSWAVLSNIDKNESRWDLKSGDYWAIFGSVELDLRTANIPLGETTIHPTAIFGSVQIIVPSDLTVVCDGTAALGSLHFLGRDHGGLVTNLEAQQGTPEGAEKVVRIDCVSVFGSIRVISRN